MNDIMTTQQRASFSLAPQDLDQALRFADMLSKSNIVPKDFQNNPGNILVAVQWGMELGLQPMQAMQNIAVINARPSLWGDAVIGLVRSSPLCEYVAEESLDDKAICRVKRRGEEEQVRIFTIDDAKKAGLFGKQGPWTQYPKRMMQMRARSWALRDVFPDVLRGMPIAEEVMDIEPRDITPHAPRLTGTQAAEAAKQTMIQASPSPERDALILRLESICKNDGQEAFMAEWKRLTKDDRAMAGGSAEAERIWALGNTGGGDE